MIMTLQHYDIIFECFQKYAEKPDVLAVQDFKVRDL